MCGATSENDPNSASGRAFLQCLGGGLLLLACFFFSLLMDTVTFSTFSKLPAPQIGVGGHNM